MIPFISFTVSENIKKSKKVCGNEIKMKINSLQQITIYRTRCTNQIITSWVGILGALIQFFFDCSSVWFSPPFRSNVNGFFLHTHTQRQEIWHSMMYMCNNEEVDVIKNILPVHRKFLSREKVFHRMDGAAVSRFFCDFVFMFHFFLKKDLYLHRNNLCVHVQHLWRV